MRFILVHSSLINIRKENRLKKQLTLYKREPVYKKIAQEKVPKAKEISVFSKI